jgi:hypothetical protein
LAATTLVGVKPDRGLAETGFVSTRQPRFVFRLIAASCGVLLVALGFASLGALSNGEAVDAAVGLVLLAVGGMFLHVARGRTASRAADPGSAGWQVPPWEKRLPSSTE